MNRGPGIRSARWLQRHAACGIDHRGDHGGRPCLVPGRLAARNYTCGACSGKGCRCQLRAEKILSGAGERGFMTVRLLLGVVVFVLGAVAGRATYAVATGERARVVDENHFEQHRSRCLEIGGSWDPIDVGRADGRTDVYGCVMPEARK